MHTPVLIRTFEGSDLPGLVALWNRTLVADPISEQRLLLEFILEPCFDPRTLLLAIDGHTTVGFLLGMTARQDRPSENAVGTGVVVAMGVDPTHRRRGIGGRLLGQLEKHWHERGVTTIVVGPWIPSYLTPGVDEAAYPGAVEFLDIRGYQRGARPISMRASLTGYVPAAGIDDTAARLADSGIDFRPAGIADALPLLEFAKAHFPHWEFYVRGNLRALVSADDTSTLTIALENARVIGFALTNGERFGPFGVDESYRGQGIGAVLLSRSLSAMRARNIHTAYFLWTSDQTARLYRRHGFEIVRRFTMMSKNLQEDPQ